LLLTNVLVAARMAEGDTGAVPFSCRLSADPPLPPELIGVDLTQLPEDALKQFVRATMYRRAGQQRWRGCVLRRRAYELGAVAARPGLQPRQRVPRYTVGYRADEAAQWLDH